ncbi:MAG: nucleotidyltransferase domain-containing protein [Halanaerobiales bacterium]|nr:nucleotidyltransferase domain-containing protein [Halanaerobiales bacterium]
MFLSSHQLKEVLLAELSHYLLFLFGSKAKGTFREDSDLDLAYLSDQDITEYDQYMLAQKLAKLSGHEVDLIIYFDFL